ncbi:MAG: hypothetical protein C3F11_09425 [Methylocystaceae bacterium]|nr:MAG: hypothetical protein C3F11_09425 [Methylocystaceae bacterium]
MAIIECTHCGFAIDAREAVTSACPACGAKPPRIVSRADEPSPRQVEEILRILEKIPDAPAEPGDEIEQYE